MIPAAESLAVRRIEPFLGREMAGQSDVEQLFGRLPVSGFTPSRLFAEIEHPSEILRTRSEPHHRLGELYDRMLEKDMELASFARKRRDAVLALPRRIVPKDGSPAALETASFVRTALEEIPGLVETFRHQLDAVSKAVTFNEVIWERLPRGPLAGALVPVDIIDRPMWRFLWRWRDAENRRGPAELYIRQPAGKEPIKAPPGKFIVAREGTKDNPWGGPGLLDDAYWYWFIKKTGWKWWAVFVEKWASPTAVGKYDHRSTGFASSGGSDGGEGASRVNQEQQAALLAALQAIQHEQAIVIPKTLEVSLLEAQRSGSISYESFVQLCTRAMALGYLGEVDTSGAGQGPGSFAKSTVSNEVRLDKVKLDAGALQSRNRDSLFRWMVELNFGPDAPRPRLVIDVGDAEDREDGRAGIELLARYGQPVTRQHLYTVARADLPGEGEDVVDLVAAAPAPVVATPAPAVNDPDDDDLDDDDREDREAPQPAARRVPPARPVSHAARSTREPATPAQRDRAGAFSLASEDLSELLEQAEARDAAMGEIADVFRPLTVAHFDQHQELAADVRERGLLHLVESLPVREHAEQIEAALIHAQGLAMAHLLEDGIDARFWRRGRPDTGDRDEPSTAASLALERGSGLIDLPMRRPLRLASMPPGFDGATRPALARDFWTRLLDIPRDSFDLLADSTRRFAFTVAGVEDAGALLDIRRLSIEADAEGWTRTRFREELAKVYEQRGLAPTSDWHADLIYQNNVRQVNGALRYQQTVRNPAAHRLTPYLFWATLGDDKVRARPHHNHLVMSDRIFAIGHSIWSTWWYPAGHGCRCYVGTINAIEARRRALTGGEPTGPWPTSPEGGQAFPDPGFAGAPDPGTLNDTAARPRMFEIAREAQDTGDEQLMEAVALIFIKLLGFNPFAA